MRLNTRRVDVKSIKFIGALALAVATLSSCSSTTASHDAGMVHSSSSPMMSPGGASTKPNAVDVMFVQMMVPHHEQAVALADLAESNTSNAQVLALAAAIKAAQQPEITMMRGWLAEWNVAGMEHSMGDDGMLTDDQMAALADARDADFDRLFLTGMIGHHQGAIAMAQTVISGGQSPDVLELARKVIASQQAEVTTMESLLAQ